MEATAKFAYNPISMGLPNVNNSEPVRKKQTEKKKSRNKGGETYGSASAGEV